MCCFFLCWDWGISFVIEACVVHPVQLSLPSLQQMTSHAKFSCAATWTEGLEGWTSFVKVPENFVLQSCPHNQDPKARRVKENYRMLASISYKNDNKKRARSSNHRLNQAQVIQLFSCRCFHDGPLSNKGSFAWQQKHLHRPKVSTDEKWKTNHAHTHPKLLSAR